jgi:hypothetical protein
MSLGMSLGMISLFPVEFIKITAAATDPNNRGNKNAIYYNIIFYSGL